MALVTVGAITPPPPPKKGFLRLLAVGAVAFLLSVHSAAVLGVQLLIEVHAHFSHALIDSSCISLTLHSSMKWQGGGPSQLHASCQSIQYVLCAHLMSDSTCMCSCGGGVEGHLPDHCSRWAPCGGRGGLGR
jgi:hypothetical protein